jgi:ABC-type phosphate transport system substrate-binding protein
MSSPVNYKEENIKTIFIHIVVFILLFSPRVDAINIISNITADTTSLSVAQLRRIYSMRQVHWQNGLPIVVYVLASKHPLHQQFCREELRLFPYQLDRIWHKLSFSGFGVAPIEVENQQALIEAIRTTKGAIGYVENLSEVKDVNIIKLDD